MDEDRLRHRHRIPAEMEWNNGLDYENKKYDLEELGFKDEDINSKENLRWNNLSKDMQEAILGLYIHPSQILHDGLRMKLKLERNPRCYWDEEWVPGYVKKNGTYVRGFCRKLKESERPERIKRIKR